MRVEFKSWNKETKLLEKLKKVWKLEGKRKTLQQQKRKMHFLWGTLFGC
jgi:hypothetical protein